MAVKKTYAVRRGRKTGLFQTWADCQKQVIGFSGAEYKSFKSLEEAKVYLAGAVSEGAGQEFTKDDGNQSTEVIVAYVDGSYNIKTHQYGSGIVILWKGEKQEFSFMGDIPVLADMRNVAGEIAGAQRAMEFAIENKAKRVIIYYDYEGIEKWCTGAWKARKEGTQLYVKAYEKLKEKIEIEFVKVAAHTGNKYNEEADILAKKALGLV